MYIVSRVMIIYLGMITIVNKCMHLDFLHVSLFGLFGPFSCYLNEHKHKPFNCPRNILYCESCTTNRNHLSIVQVNIQMTSK